MEIQKELLGIKKISNLNNISIFNAEKIEDKKEAILKLMEDNNKIGKTEINLLNILKRKIKRDDSI